MGISSHEMPPKALRPCSVMVKNMRRLSAVPMPRSMRPLRSAAAITFEAFEGVSPSISPSSPDESLIPSLRLHSTIPSFRLMP